MTASDVRSAIGGKWEERGGAWWGQAPAASIRAAAAVMLAAGGRLSALVAVPREGGCLDLSWHWDLGGAVLSVSTRLQENEPAPSIVDLYPGADWAERETREYCAVTFGGRAATPPLMLREGDEPGVLLRPEGRAR